ncbi:MAG: DciA family protein [Bryobacteraceae bacterium]
MERAGKALAKLKLSAAISPEQLAFAAWPAAVGERIAAHAWPKALVRGSLWLEAEDAVWQQQLFHLRFDILAKLSELLGSGMVTDLEFRVASAAPRRPPQTARSHSETLSPDDADRIKDPVLRIVYKQARDVAMRKDAAMRKAAAKKATA